MKKKKKKFLDGKSYYRYSSSNIYHNKNFDIKNNNILKIHKSSNLLNRNKMVKSANINTFKKEKNFLFPNQKLLKFHKINYNLTKNNSKEQNVKILCRKNIIIKSSEPKIIKEYKKQKIIPKKSFSTRSKSKLNIPKNIFSLDDLLDINEKNAINNLSEQITKYDIGKTIGRGAYAMVKIVTDKITNEKYAAKIYNKSETKDKIRKKCVSNEIEILKKVSHKNIIKLIEVIELKEHILIIQELFNGISLSDYYKKNWKSEDLSKQKEKTYKIILRQIFEAINYLHKNNIAHLDIKLDNILINKNLEIKLIDFGFGIYDPKKELNNFFGGTPSYMSPEIVLKRPYISILSDIWSLGVLVFKLFCNEYPFKGMTEKDLYNCIKKGKYRINLKYHEYIKEIIDKMGSKEKEIDFNGKSLLFLIDFDKSSLEEIEEYDFNTIKLKKKLAPPSCAVNFLNSGKIVTIVNELGEIKKKYLYFTQDFLKVIAKSTKSNKPPKKKYIINTINITSIIKGYGTEAFKKSKRFYRSVPELDKCFSIIAFDPNGGGEQSINVICDKKSETNKWIRYIKDIIIFLQENKRILKNINFSEIKE